MAIGFNPSFGIDVEIKERNCRNRLPSCPAVNSCDTRSVFVASCTKLDEPGIYLKKEVEENPGTYVEDVLENGETGENFVLRVFPDFCKRIAARKALVGGNTDHIELTLCPEYSCIKHKD